MDNIFKIAFLLGLWLEAWWAAELDPIRTGLGMGFPFNARFLWTNPVNRFVARASAEIMIWGSCFMLLSHHFTPWIWIGIGIVGSFYLPKRFKHNARKKDQFFQSMLISGYLKNKIM